MVAVETIGLVNVHHTPILGRRIPTKLGQPEIQQPILIQYLANVDRTSCLARIPDLPALVLNE